MILASGFVAIFLVRKRDMKAAKPHGGVIAGSTSQLLLPVVSGLLVAATFPPFDLWWLAWVALVPLGVSVSLSNRVLEPAIGAFIACGVLHLIGLDWIRTSYQGSGLDGPFAVAWLVTALVMSPAWVVTVGFCNVLFHKLLFPMSVALPAGWILGEVTRRLTGLVLTETDFPMLQLAATQMDFPQFIQVADIVGAGGVSVLIAFANGTLCEILRAKNYRHKVRAAIAATTVFTLVFGYGAWRLSQPPFRNGPTVCLMPRDSLPSTITDPSSLRNIADILLWTECALRDDGATDAAQAAEIERFSKATGAFVAIGWRRRRPNYTANSLAFADPSRGLVGIYDKTCLVPWTEFSPWLKIPYIPWSEKLKRAGADHSTYLCGDTRIAPAICYDACFPALLGRFESPDMFLVSSSESADGTKRLPRHVIQLVRLNAIQLRRTIVRNVRGGQSGVIDGCGRVRFEVENIEQPVVVGPVPIDNRFSLYAKFGDSVLLLPATVLIACAFRRWRIVRHAERSFSSENQAAGA